MDLCFTFRAHVDMADVAERLREWPEAEAEDQTVTFRGVEPMSSFANFGVRIGDREVSFQKPNLDYVSDEATGTVLWPES